MFISVYLNEHIINKWKEINVKTNEKNIVYDDITNYGITIINNDMYLIKGGKVMKLDALIIKERNNKDERN